MDRFRIRRVRFTPAPREGQGAQPSANTALLPFAGTGTVLTQAGAELNGCAELLLSIT